MFADGAIAVNVLARRAPCLSAPAMPPPAEEYPRSATQDGPAKVVPHKARDHAARLTRAVAAPDALGHHRTLICNCRDEQPNVTRELAGEADAESR